MESKKLQGKIAIVTGGSRGIGAAIVKRFAEEGSYVAFSYAKNDEKAFSLVEKLQQAGFQVLAMQVDQADPKQVQKFIHKVIELFGRIDIVVNNAGIYTEASIDDPHFDIEEMQRLFKVNVGGVFFTTFAAVPYLKPGGRIIIIGSINGDRVGYAAGADYSATKAALKGYTRGWARDLGPKNITVNLIQPGHTATDMNPDNTEFSREIKKNIPLGRYAKPEDIASAALFLASEDASYITGSTLTVDGGFLA